MRNLKLHEQQQQTKQGKREKESKSGMNGGWTGLGWAGQAQRRL